MGSERSTSGLRRIAAPFVVPVPAGARTRTRLRLTAEEEEALRRVGDHLGTVYRSTLADLIEANPADAKARAAWRAKSKRDITAQTSSRWAGAITRTALDARRLGIQNLYAERRSLTAAVKTIGERLGAPVGGFEHGSRAKPGAIRGYGTESERFAKSRR